MACCALRLPHSSLTWKPAAERAGHLVVGTMQHLCVETSEGENDAGEEEKVLFGGGRWSLFPPLGPPLFASAPVMLRCYTHKSAFHSPVEYCPHALTMSTLSGIFINHVARVLHTKRKSDGLLPDLNALVVHVIGRSLFLYPRSSYVVSLALWSRASCSCCWAQHYGPGPQQLGVFVGSRWRGEEEEEEVKPLWLQSAGSSEPTESHYVGIWHCGANVKHSEKLYRNSHCFIYVGYREVSSFRTS